MLMKFKDDSEIKIKYLKHSYHVEISELSDQNKNT